MPITPRRSGRARKPKNFENFEVQHDFGKEAPDDNDSDSDEAKPEEDSDSEEEQSSPRKSHRLSRNKKSKFSQSPKSAAKSPKGRKNVKSSAGRSQSPTKGKKGVKRKLESESPSKGTEKAKDEIVKRGRGRPSKGGNSEGDKKSDKTGDKDPKKDPKRRRSVGKEEDADSADDKREEAEKDIEKTAEEIERDKKMSEVWSIVRPQYQTMCNIMEAAGIENLLMTSYLSDEDFHYLGSDRGVKFLENKVGFPQEKPSFLNDDQSTDQTDTNSQFVWKIVEKNANDLITALSKAGVESLMLTSIMGDVEGFGYQGSEKGLDFLKEIQDLGKLFSLYSKGDVNHELEFQKTSISSRWYRHCGGEVTVEVQEDHTYSTETTKKRTSRKSQVKITDVPLDMSLVDPNNPQCPICLKNFRTEKILRKHYQLHMTEKEHECSECHKKFLRKYDMQNHQIRMHDFVSINKGEVISHDDAKALNIIGDNSKFTLKKEPDESNEGDGTADAVVKTEINGNSIGGDTEDIDEADLDVKQELLDKSCSELVQCPECSKVLKNKVMLQKHLENHRTPKDIKCLVDSCKKVFKRKWDMEYHVVTIHDYIKVGPGNVVPSKDVPEEIRSKMNRLGNRRRRPGDEEELNEDDPLNSLQGTDCPDCHKKFKTNAILKRHYAVHIGNKNFICEVCSKSFLRKYDLQVHQIKVHGYKKSGKGAVVKPENEDFQDLDVDALPSNLKTHSRGKKRPLFRCKYCPMVSFTQNNLDIHLEKNHQEHFPFQCSECDEKFQLKRKYNTHWYTNHANRKHNCPHCDKTFVFKYHLRDHLLTHEKDAGGYLCTLCGKSFSLLKYLRKHEQRHDEKQKNEELGPKVYNCKICDKTVDTLAEYQGHMKTHVDVEERKFSCFECGKKFFKLGHLKRHSFVHVKERAYQCEHCDKRYKDPDTLKKHVICMHDVKFNRRKTYTCEICEKAFLSYGHLRRHCLSHTGERPFQCDLCDKTFKEKAGMIAHRRIHTGERPFACHKCGRTFVQPAHLRRHMFLHTQIRNFICQICGKGFFQNDELRKHLTVHNQEKAHKCKFCNKAFHHLSSMKTHERTHTGVKPFQCDVCKQRFTQKNSMLIHRRRHTNERPFKCSECGRCFTSKQLCKLHIRSHFPENYPRHKCPKCHKDYSVKQKLRKHILQKHGEEELVLLPAAETNIGRGDPFVLIIQNIKNENEAEGDKDGEDYEIDGEECNSQEINDIEEENVQTEITDLTCEICLMRFENADTLNKHKILHKESEKHFECDVCLERFAQREGLQTHLVQQHGFIRSGDDVIRLEIESMPSATVSPSKYLNKSVNLVMPSKSTNSPNTIIIPTVSTASAQSSSLIQKDGNIYKIVHVAPKTSTNVSDKDGTVLRIVSPCYTQENPSITTASPVTTTVTMSSPTKYETPQTTFVENENQVVITTACDDNSLGIAPINGQEDAAIRSIMADVQEFQQFKNHTEIIETQTVPETIPQVPDTEVDTTLSEIDFDQEGGISEATAANLAALYGTDKIIYQEERNDGTEVVHVYAIIPKAE